MFFKKKKAMTAEEWVINRIKSIKVEDLVVRKIMLKYRIDRLQSEVRKIETEIQMLPEMAKKAKSNAKERSTAMQIKTLLLRREMSLDSLLNLKMELIDVSNLLILKEHEKDLKSASVRNILRKLKPELEIQQILNILKEHEEDLKSAGVWDILVPVLKRWLVLRNMKEEDIDELASIMASIKTSRYLKNLKKYDSQNEDDLDDILDAIRAVKEDKDEDAGKVLRKEKETLK